jgi:hypothetical protein
VENMPQTYALSIDRVARMDMFLKIFVAIAKAAAKPTHGWLKTAKIEAMYQWLNNHIHV